MNQISTKKTLLYKCLRPDSTWNSKSWFRRFIAQVSNFSSRKSTRAVCFWKGIQNPPSWDSCYIGVERGPVYSRAAVLNLFGIRDQFQERQSSHRWWQGWGMTQAHDISYATTDLTGGRAQVVMWAMGYDCKYKRNFACSPAPHLLLCGPVPNRPPNSTGPCPKGWGPLI